MKCSLWPLAIAATLLCPLAAQAQTPPTPPVAPAAPIAPTTLAPAKKHDHMHGKVTAVDATAKTVTLTTKHGSEMLTLTSDATIYKPGDTGGKPTGAFSDIVVGSSINVHLMADAATPTANEVHIAGPHKKKGDDAPATPATPTTPATP